MTLEENEKIWEETRKVEERKVAVDKELWSWLPCNSSIKKDNDKIFFVGTGSFVTDQTLGVLIPEGRGQVSQLKQAPG